MIELQQLVWGWLDALAHLLPVGYAVGAGMVSTANPCGFAMLPAYLALFLGAGQAGFSERSVTRRALQALLVGLTVSAGFVVLFAVVGAVVSAGGRFLFPAMPWVSVLIGGALVVLGLAMLAGRTLPTGRLAGLAARVGGPAGPGVRGFFLFGLAFGATSLSCTLPIFLAVVGTALASGGFLPGLAQFLGYGAGMGLVLVALTLGMAVFKEGFVLGGLRGVAPYFERVSAVLLLVAGAYIVYYWLIYAGLARALLAAGGPAG